MAQTPKRWLLLLPACFFALLAGVFFNVLTTEEYDPHHVPSATVGGTFPEFSLPALGDGQLLTRDTIIGKPLLVNVWATWCISCRVEHGFLNKLAAEGVPIVGVNYKDDPTAASKWLEDLGDPYTQVIVDQDGTLGLDLGVYGAPETYFVDGKGVIQHKFTGVLTVDLWDTELKAIYASLLGH